jgi:hypothetical protein
MILFSHTLNINMSMERLVCDSWLEVKFAMAQTAQNQLLAAAMLRGYQQELLDLKLSGTTAHGYNNKEAVPWDGVVPSQLQTS